MAATLVSNGDVLAGKSSPAPKSRVASVYSEVQASRIDHALPLPSVLRNPFKIVDGPASSAAGNPGRFLVPSDQQSFCHKIDFCNASIYVLLKLWFLPI